MGLVKYDIQERSFDRSKSSQYELSILFGVGSFAYIVRGYIDGQLLAYRSVELDTQLPLQESLDRAFREDDILRPNTIRQSRIAWQTATQTLVPDRLFLQEAATTYLEQLSDSLGGQEVSVDRLTQQHTKLVYGKNENYAEIVKRRFNPRSESHIGSSLLQNWAASSPGRSTRGIYANFRDNQVLLAGIEQGNIQYFNLFSYREAKDALYFVLLAFQQCGWSPTSIPLYLSGEVLAESAVFKQLFRFVKRLEFNNMGFSEELIGPEIAKLPQHLYSDLMTIGQIY